MQTHQYYEEKVFSLFLLLSFRELDQNTCRECVMLCNAGIRKSVCEPDGCICV